MNPFFYILVLLGLIAIFFLLNKLFRPIGGYLKAIYKETKESIGPDDTEKNIMKNEENKDE
jgi:hypothetical protein